MKRLLKMLKQEQIRSGWLIGWVGVAVLRRGKKREYLILPIDIFNRWPLLSYA